VRDRTSPERSGDLRLEPTAGLGDPRRTGEDQRRMGEWHLNEVFKKEATVTVSYLPFTIVTGVMLTELILSVPHQAVDGLS
jgi:hypothetical protein